MVGENPFAVARIRPGAIEYCQHPEHGDREVLERVVQSGWRGQIVGPHGSGKTTLLLRLLALCPGRFSSIEWWTILPRAPWALWANCRREETQYNAENASAKDTLYIVEGWEWWRGWQRWASWYWGILGSPHVLLTGRKRLLGAGPVIASLRPDEELFCAIVGRLQRDVSDPLPREVIRQAWRDRQGDLREALFQLYDEYQSRRCYTSVA